MGDGSGNDSIGGKFGEDKMCSTTGSVIGNQGHCNPCGGSSSDNSDYGSNNSLIDKQENSAYSMGGKSKTGKTNNKLTRKSSSYKTWLLALIIPLGIMLFCMSRRNKMISI